MREGRPSEARGCRKKLIARAEWEWGEAGEVAAARARIERGLRLRAEREGREYVSPYDEPIEEAPELLEENEDAWELFLACSSQLILGPMGGVVGVRHDTLAWRMDHRDIPRERRIELEQQFLVLEALYVKHLNASVKKPADGDKG